ncbi:response regulator [Gammaproteobacteria bacterium LSUCC0112]|nr:response regulator [Gammaproteobacteria bacterium LSUCC0112]
MSDVLIVDDKEENRYYLQALLGAHGYTVSVARHGAEALVLARQSRPQLVVSDLLMPVMDGYTLLRHWKSDSGLCAVPFIVYTATYTQEKDEKLAMDLGADAFILKPAEPDDFVALVRIVSGRTAKPGVAAATAGRVDETDVLKHYSETLIRKLEEKSLQLSEANRLLALDITRREKAEAALRDSEERFRLMAGATNDAVWDWDIVHDAVWWGDGFMQLFGYSGSHQPDNLDAWSALIHPDDVKRVNDGLSQVLQDSNHWRVRYRLRRADGSWAEVEDRAQLIRDNNGKAIRMIGGLTDFSERIALEERLRNAQRLEAIGKLTGGIAHDFNNLLTVVLGNAETLSELLEYDVQKSDLARMIVSAAERGAELTQRMLAFARKQSLSPRAVDVNQLLQGVNLMLDRVLGASVKLTFRPGEHLPAAMVDPSQLENSVLNLCVNARDAMPAGGTLLLSTDQLQLHEETLYKGRWVPAGHYVVLAVSDTGTGIPSEHLSRIYEPFFSTKPEGKGAGLGLAMVYGFVQQTGGQIVVETTPDQGSTFSLMLPAASAAEQVTQQPDSANAGDIPGGTETVLLVEDDALVRQLAQFNLESLGYQVLVAASGEAALEILNDLRASSQHIDLLFTDVQMTGMTGLDLWAKAQVLYPDLRVLYTSGYSSRLMNADMPVLTKPYRRAELAAALASAFGRRMTQATAS